MTQVQMMHKPQALEWNKLDETCMIDTSPNDTNMSDICEMTHVWFLWHTPLLGNAS
jgi:hypothetical protein